MDLKLGRNVTNSNFWKSHKKQKNLPHWKAFLHRLGEDPICMFGLRREDRKPYTWL